MTCVSACDLKASRRFLCRGFNILEMFTKLAHNLSKRHDCYFIIAKTEVITTI